MKQHAGSRTLVLVAALTAVASFAVLEVALRLFRDDDRYFPYYPNSVRVGYPSEEVTPGVSGVSRLSANSLGTRGHEPSGRERLRILTIGGSTTADTLLDDEETWSARLEQYLGDELGDRDLVWVANSGKDGLNSHHHLMHARYLVPRLLPLDYAIVYAGSNDMGMWYHHPDFDPHFLDDPENWNSRIGEAFRWSWHTPKSWPIYKRTEIWKALSWLKSRYHSRSARKGDRAEHDQDAELKWRENALEGRSERARRLQPKGKLALLPEALDSYEGILDRIVIELRGHGVEPILVQEVTSRRDRLWTREMDGGEVVTKEQYPAILTEYNRRMARVADAHGALWIDLPERIARDSRLFYDGGHFNEDGARAAARAIADAMISAGLLAPIRHRIAAMPSDPLPRE